MLFTYSEAKLDYDQFAADRSIDKAKKYMIKHKEDLDRSEKNYGVDSQVITAILLVESRTGKIPGHAFHPEYPIHPGLPDRPAYTHLNFMIKSRKTNGFQGKNLKNQPKEDQNGLQGIKSLFRIYTPGRIRSRRNTPGLLPRAPGCSLNSCPAAFLLTEKTATMTDP